MSDIEFVKDEEQQPKRKPVKNRVPSEYIPIKLSSLGKLDAPEVLHVRDYSGEDVLILATSNSEQFLPRLIEVLNNVTYEGFDCAYLHEAELEEIMLNILSNFWSSKISDYPYPYTNEEYDSMDDERKERVSKGLENLVIDIPINNLKTTPLDSKFEEPITIKDNDGHLVAFRLPRIQDVFAAREYMEKVYAEQYQKYNYIENIYRIDNSAERERKLSEIDTSILREYEEFTNKRMVTFIKAKQASLLMRHGSKTLSILDEKVKEYPTISTRFWRQFDKFVADNLQFGVQHDVEMISPITKKKVTRRCYFRPVDYVPSHELPDDREYSFVFGT